MDKKNSKIIFPILTILLITSISVTTPVKAYFADFSSERHPWGTFTAGNGVDGYAEGESFFILLYFNVTLTQNGMIIPITNVSMSATLPEGLTLIDQVSIPASTSFNITGRQLMWDWNTQVLSSAQNSAYMPADWFFQATAEINVTVNNLSPIGAYMTTYEWGSYNLLSNGVFSNVTITETMYKAESSSPEPTSTPQPTYPPGPASTPTSTPKPSETPTPTLTP